MLDTGPDQLVAYRQSRLSRADDHDVDLLGHGRDHLPCPAVTHPQQTLRPMCQTVKGKVCPVDVRSSALKCSRRNGVLATRRCQVLRRVV
jgi:hypothetical protein